MHNNHVEYKNKLRVRDFAPFVLISLWTELPLGPICVFNINVYNSCDMHVMKHEQNSVSFVVGLFNNLDMVKPNGSEFDLKWRIVYRDITLHAAPQLKNNKLVPLLTGFYDNFIVHP
jgi:hypothetical protein